MSYSEEWDAALDRLRVARHEFDKEGTEETRRGLVSARFDLWAVFDRWHPKSNDGNALPAMPEKGSSA